MRNLSVLVVLVGGLSLVASLQSLIFPVTTSLTQDLAALDWSQDDDYEVIFDTSGTYTGCTSTVAFPLGSARSVSIVGNGALIDCEGANVNLLSILSSTISISDLTVTRLDTFMYEVGTFLSASASNVTFTAVALREIINTANAGGGGGGVLVRLAEGSKGDFESCIFHNNTATAGCITAHHNSEATVHACNFTSNLVGTAATSGASFTFNHVTFTENGRADIWGSATYLTGSGTSAAYVDCLFDSNIGDYGTLTAQLGASVEVDYCEFRSNVGSVAVVLISDSHFGGRNFTVLDALPQTFIRIEWASVGTIEDLLITNTRFLRVAQGADVTVNRVIFDGGEAEDRPLEVIHETTVVIVTQCVFKDLFGNYYGTVADVEFGATLLMYDCLFDNVTSPLSPSPSGALQVWLYGKAHVYSSSFTRLQGGYGHVLNMYDHGEASFENCTFSESIGHFYLVAYSVAHVTNSTFSDLLPYGWTQAIVAVGHDSLFTATNVLVERSANPSGSNVFVELRSDRAVGLLRNVTVKDCGPKYTSGAAATHASYLEIVDSLFIDNVAVDGPIVSLYIIEDAKVVVNGTAFINNVAARDIGAIAIDTTEAVLLYQCDFVSNSYLVDVGANVAAADVYAVGGNVSIIDCWHSSDNVSIGLGNGNLLVSGGGAVDSKGVFMNAFGTTDPSFIQVEVRDAHFSLSGSEDKLFDVVCDAFVMMNCVVTEVNLFGTLSAFNFSLKDSSFIGHGSGGGTASQLSGEFGVVSGIVMEHFHAFEWTFPHFDIEDCTLVDGGFQATSFKIFSNAATWRRMRVENCLRVEINPHDAAIVVDSFFINCATTGALSTSGLVQNCSFEGNAAKGGNYVDGKGGAILLVASSSIIDCVFLNNEASIAGGALGQLFEEYVFVLTGCIFSGNRAREGGAVSIVGQADLSVSNTVFEGNVAYEGSGHVLLVGGNSASTATFINCSLSGNGEGGATDGLSGVLDQPIGSFILVDCLLQNNKGTGILALSAVGLVTVSLTRSTLINNAPVSLLTLGATVHLTQSYLHSNTSVVANLWMVGGLLSLDQAVVVGSHSASLLVISTVISSLSSSLINTAPLSGYAGSSSFEGTFVVSSTLGSPALTCSPQTTLSNTLLCSPSPAGSPAFPPILESADSCILSGALTSESLGGGPCFDVCESGGGCAPAGLGGPALSSGLEGPPLFFFNSFGCPLCGGGCMPESNPCNLTQSICVDAAGGSALCQCREDWGYRSESGFSPCIDIDECAVVPSPCANIFGGAVCVNNDGSFTCECPVGYTLSGSSCNDINECDNAVYPCTNGLCMNLAGSFLCTCSDNFFLTPGGSTCRPCPNNGWSSGGSSTSCSCVSGFVWNSTTFTCDSCPPGSMASDQLCVSCPVDTYNDGQALACTACVSPQTTNGLEGQVTCSCPRFYVRNDDDCDIACPPGSFVDVPNEDSLQCQACEPGTYSTTVNAVSCESCPVGMTTTQEVYSSSPSSSSLGATSLANCSCLPGRVPIENGPGCALDCAPGSEYKSSSDVCVTCSVNSWGAGGGASCVPCGFFSSTQGVAGSTSEAACVCLPGFAVLLPNASVPICESVCAPGSRSVSGTSCELCGSNSYTSSVSERVCTPCRANARSPPNSTSEEDCRCAPGFYSSVSGSALAPCLACPTGGLCRGDLSSPVAAPGYYAGENVNGFVECVPAGACLGDNVCAAGYSGHLCAECAAGSYRLNGKCRPCTSSVTAVGVLCLTILVVGASCMLWLNLGEDGGFASTNHAASLLIALNSFQVVASFGQLDIEWPDSVQRVFDAFSLANFNVELVGIECFVQTEGSPFLLRWIVTALLPLYLASGLGVAVGLFSLAVWWRSGTSALSPSGQGRVPGPAAAPASSHGAPTATAAAAAAAASAAALSLKVRLSQIRGAALRAFVQGLLLAYLPLTLNSFEPLQCVDSGDGYRVVASSRDLVCYGRGYWSAFVAGLLSLLVVVVGFPLGLSAFLFRRRRALSEADFFATYFVVVGKYRSRVYLYEVLVLARKAAFAVAFTFVSASPYVSAVAGAFVGLSAFVLNRVAAPFLEVPHNYVESASLMGCLLLIEAGATMRDTHYADSGRAALVIVILLLNLLVVLGSSVYDGYRLWLAWRGLEQTAVRTTKSRTLLHVTQVGARGEDEEDALRTWAGGGSSMVVEDTRAGTRATVGTHASDGGGNGGGRVLYTPNEHWDLLQTIVPPPPSGSPGGGGGFLGVGQGGAQDSQELDLRTSDSLVSSALPPPLPLPLQGDKALVFGKDDNLRTVAPFSTSQLPLPLPPQGQAVAPPFQASQALESFSNLATIVPPPPSSPLPSGGAAPLGDGRVYGFHDGVWRATPPPVSGLVFVDHGHAGEEEEEEEDLHTVTGVGAAQSFAAAGSPSLMQIGTGTRSYQGLPEPPADSLPLPLSPSALLRGNDDETNTFDRELESFVKKPQAPSKPGRAAKAS